MHVTDRDRQIDRLNSTEEQGCRSQSHARVRGIFTTVMRSIPNRQIHYLSLDKLAIEVVYHKLEFNSQFDEDIRIIHKIYLRTASSTSLDRLSYRSRETK